MDSKKNNTVWWVLGIIVLIVIVIIGVHAHKKNVAMEAANSAQTSDTTGDDALASEDVTDGSVDAPATTGTAPVTLSYAQALVTYKDKRIQFDPSCAAMPGSQTWTSGTNVMLDNRSANTLSLHLGTIGNISIKPWGFKIVKMTGTPLPATVLIDCGTRQNVATVVLQK